MSQLQISNFNSIEKIFGNNTVRILYDNDNNVWFVCKDIANILEYKNTRDAILKHVDDEDKIIF
jgi:anti-repressor protein